MSKIQTDKCLQCKQNKEGITFEVPMVDTLPPQTTTKHYCWADLEDLLGLELEKKCAEWERNKKKIFREALGKCKKKQTFEWPWREKSLSEHGGDNSFERIQTICEQCNVWLHWDVTPYKDSAKHICSYCSNCNQFIKGTAQTEHFSWNEDVKPVYKCEKKELIFDSKYNKHANCLECNAAFQQEKGGLINELANHGSIFCYVVGRPNSKAHCNLTTKRHVNSLWEMKPEEWNDLLPVLKNSILKIDKVYKPVGYRISIPCGRLAGQKANHFYMRIVPKYKKDYGSIGTDWNYRPGTVERNKEIEKALNPSKDNILFEQSEVGARLHNEVFPACITIFTKKKLPNDIHSINSKTWSQIHRVLQEFMRKAEVKLGYKDFVIRIEAGKGAMKLWREEKVEQLDPAYNKKYSENEFTIIVFPKASQDRKISGRWASREKKDNKILGSMENERIAEKLRDPEDYRRKWGKTNVSQTSNENQFNWWWVVLPMGGAIILLLGIIIFQNSKTKKKKPSK